MVINLDNDMTLMLNFVEFVVTVSLLSRIGLFACWMDVMVMVIVIVGCIFKTKDILTLILLPSLEKYFFQPFCLKIWMKSKLGPLIEYLIYIQSKDDKFELHVRQRPLLLSAIHFNDDYFYVSNTIISFCQQLYFKIFHLTYWIYSLHHY